MVSSGISVALSCCFVEVCFTVRCHERADTTLPLFASAQEPKVSKMRQLLLHTSSNVQCATHTQNLLALLVTCWTKLTRLRVEMALGVLLDVCCVREARQASHIVCKQAASCKPKVLAHKFHQESSTSQARRTVHKLAVH